MLVLHLWQHMLVTALLAVVSTLIMYILWVVTQASTCSMLLQALGNRDRGRPAGWGSGGEPGRSLSTCALLQR